jgi:EAL domain-containing protein (putative c-di-GMP-specific phosphodiesterase class I)/GGDEF domain-containing protein
MPQSAYITLLNRLEKRRFHPCAALIYLDVRHMRALNRFSNPQHGDQMLATIGEMLAAWAGARGVSGRLWSNEFIAAKAIDHAQSAVDDAELLRNQLASLRYPSMLGESHLATSIGLTVVRPRQDWAIAIQHASEACEQAKRRGFNQVVSHSNQHDNPARDAADAHLVSNFRKLMSEGRLVLHPQPIMDIRQGIPKLAKVEFLIRQQDGDTCKTLPTRTIEVLESLGLATELDRYAADFVLEWLLQNPRVMDRLDSISINLSAKSIGDGHFVDSLYREVKNARLPPGKLCFEITETAAIDHLDLAAEVITAFRSLGCKFSLDDFGSGLCSFGYLQSLPVDEVKIDGRFTRDITDNPVSREIVRAIHQVARATGKKTVAEFVDNTQKLEVLKSIGIDYAQGWLFSPAVPPEQLLAMLRQTAAA